MNLVISKCADQKYGFIAEEYSIGWSKLKDKFVQIEPGHQYEWSWLLLKWSRFRNHNEDIKSSSLRLLKFGEKYGLDRDNLLVVNSITSNFEINKSEAKIWPQCERLKAWLAFYSINNNKKSSFNEIQSFWIFSRLMKMPKYNLRSFFLPGTVHFNHERAGNEGNQKEEKGVFNQDS